MMRKVVHLNKCGDLLLVCKLDGSVVGIGGGGRVWGVRERIICIGVNLDNPHVCT